MVPDVGIADAGGDADGAGAGGKQRGLADAEAASALKDNARPIVGWIGEIDIRVVHDAVADALEEPQHAFEIASGIRADVASECDHLRGIAVDEAAGLQILCRHRNDPSDWRAALAAAARTA